MVIREALHVPGQVFCHSARPNRDAVKPIVNQRSFVKPLGGLWTTPVGAPTWSDWCRDSDWGDWPDHGRHVLTPRADVRVAVVGSLRDLLALIEAYPGESLMEPVVDFERMAGDGWDGIWLTDAGFRATHLSSPGLYGWDLESTLWFRWVFRELEDDE